MGLLRLLWLPSSYPQLFFSQHAARVETPGCFAPQKTDAPKKLSGNPDISLVLTIFSKALARPTFFVTVKVV